MSDSLNSFFLLVFFIRLTQRILVSLIIVQNLAHSLINPVIKSTDQITCGLRGKDTDIGLLIAMIISD